MKVSGTNSIQAQPLQHTLDATMEHLENSSAYPAEIKSATKVIANNIQQKINTIYPTGLYHAKTEDVKSSIVQALEDIKNNFHEKPWLAALKTFGTGLKLAGIGKAFVSGEFGMGDIKDISTLSGFSSFSGAIPSNPPTDIIGIVNLFVEKAIEISEKPE